ncbi:MAG: carbamoyl phosphate synthase small subunit, partial [Proteobacteria bacterium]|nr:carbamoyl phosphate synthase small subunit [Pseudomonadota bacterium]
MTFFDAALYLEKGHFFEGKGFGAESAKGGEAVFNTGMSGYQEIYTDPSYLNQIVVMGSSQIGNTGVNPQDLESSSLLLSGVVVREY